MTNKFAPTSRSLESSNYVFGSYKTNGRQRVNSSTWKIRDDMAAIFSLKCSRDTEKEGY